MKVGDGSEVKGAFEGVFLFVGDIHNYRKSVCFYHSNGTISPDTWGIYLLYYEQPDTEYHITEYCEICICGSCRAGVYSIGNTRFIQRDRGYSLN